MNQWLEKLRRRPGVICVHTDKMQSHTEIGRGYCTFFTQDGAEGGKQRIHVRIHPFGNSARQSLLGLIRFVSRAEQYASISHHTAVRVWDWHEPHMKLDMAEHRIIFGLAKHPKEKHQRRIKKR